MNRLDKIIKEEALKFPVGLLDGIDPMPETVEEIPDAALVNWSRVFMQFLRANASDLHFGAGVSRGEVDSGRIFYAKLAGAIGKLPASSDTWRVRNALTAQLLWEGWRWKSNRQPGKHTKSTFSWYVFQSNCVTLAALLEANEKSRVKACADVANLIDMDASIKGLSTSGETIRRDWFTKFGDSILLHHTEESFSMPRMKVVSWLEELRHGLWRDALSTSPNMRLSFVSFAATQKGDLIFRYLPDAIRRSGVNFLNETENLGD